MKSRSGLTLHYDAIARNVRELERLLQTLQGMPAFLSRSEALDLRRRLDGASALVRDKSQLVENFKTQNAVLRNSQRFLRKDAWPVHGRSASSRGIQEQLDALLSALMLLDVASDASVAQKLASAIDALEALHESKRAAGLGPDVAVVVRHARVVAAKKPIVDTLVRRALSMPLGEVAGSLEESHAADLRLHVLRAGPLGRQHEQVLAVRPAEHAGKAVAIELDVLEFLAPLADPDRRPSSQSRPRSHLRRRS